MKERIFDFLLAATVSAVVTILVILQESLIGSETLAMACVGSIAGVIAGVMKMLAVDNKFDKWSLLSYFVGVAVIYISVALGVLFRI